MTEDGAFGEWDQPVPEGYSSPVLTLDEIDKLADERFGDKAENDDVENELQQELKVPIRPWDSTTDSDKPQLQPLATNEV